MIDIADNEPDFVAPLALHGMYPPHRRYRQGMKTRFEKRGKSHIRIGEIYFLTLIRLSLDEPYKDVIIRSLSYLSDAGKKEPFFWANKAIERDGSISNTTLFLI